MTEKKHLKSSKKKRPKAERQRSFLLGNFQEPTAKQERNPNTDIISFIIACIIVVLGCIINATYTTAKTTKERNGNKHEI